MSERHSGLAQMQFEAEEAMRRNAAEAAARAEFEAQQEAARQAQQAELTAAIDRRAQDLSALNDAAELRVFGSRGRTYEDADGNVIADSRNQLPSKVDEIRQNRRFGSPDEREKVASEYQADIQDSLDRGLELSQAEMLANRNLASTEEIGKLTGSFVGQGMSPDAAHRRATDLHRQKMNKLTEIVVENGIMSEEQYKEYMDSKTSKTPTAPRPGTGAGEAEGATRRAGDAVEPPVRAPGESGTLRREPEEPAGPGRLRRRLNRARAWWDGERDTQNRTPRQAFMARIGQRLMDRANHGVTPAEGGEGHGARADAEDAEERREAEARGTRVVAGAGATAVRGISLMQPRPETSTDDDEEGETPAPRTPEPRRLGNAGGGIGRLNARRAPEGEGEGESEGEGIRGR